MITGSDSAGDESPAEQNVGGSVACDASAESVLETNPREVSLFDANGSRSSDKHHSVRQIPIHFPICGCRAIIAEPRLMYSPV